MAKAMRAKFRRGDLLWFLLPIDLTWGAAILLGIVYWHFGELWVRSVRTPLPQFNMGPFAMAIFGGVFAMIGGPLFGHLFYKRRSDRVANFIAVISLVLFGVFAIARYEFSPPIFLLNETVSDDFAFFLIALTLFSAVFPMLHYIVKPDTKAIRKSPAHRRKRRNRGRRKHND